MSAYALQRDRKCPYCHTTNTKVVGRKFGVLQLRRCLSCELLFRWPKDSPQRNAVYYQHRYCQPGLTTDLPDSEQLAALTATGFRGTEKDFAEKIALLRQVCSHGRVLDFGCSWGYGVVQLRAAGYEAVGFEISRPRAAYGRERLGINIIDSYEMLDGLPAGIYDVIFSNHVLEHLPTPWDTLQRFSHLLCPGGFILAFVPNCGGRAATCLGTAWGPLVCEGHPIAFNRQFVERSLPQHGFDVLVLSEPYRPSEIRRLLNAGLRAEDVDGDELLILGRRRGNALSRVSENTEYRLLDEERLG